MLRLSKLTDYAVVVLVRLSHADTVQTSPGIAAATGIPEPTVAKVLKTLAAGGLVASQRGAHGGYRLLRQLAAIPVADVIAAVDGPIALTACVDGTSRQLRVRGHLPGARPLGPGERGDPPGAVGDHAGGHAGSGDPARLPPARRARARPHARPHAASTEPRAPDRADRRRRIAPGPQDFQQGVAMPAVTETLDTVRAATQSGYKWGFETTIEMDLAPKGLNRGHHPADLRAQGRTRLAAGLAAEGARRVADRWKSRTGRASSTRRSTTRTCTTTPRRRRSPGRKAWTRSIRNCCAPTRSSAFR